MKAQYTITLTDGTAAKVERFARLSPSLDERDRALAAVNAAGLLGPVNSLDGVASVVERTERVGRNGKIKRDLSELYVSAAEVEARTERNRLEHLLYRHEAATFDYLRQLDSIRDELQKAADEVARTALLLQTSVDLPDSHRGYHDRGTLRAGVAIRYAADTAEKVGRLAGRMDLQHLIRYAAEVEEAATARNNA
jgi:hypothetical protein